MDVTVAICTWNRAALLDQTLGQMRHLHIPDGIEWELLVVNNNSTDDTDEVIARHTDRLPIRRLFEPEPGLSHARNRVLANSCGELILWTDDDVLVDSGWMDAVVSAARRHPNAAGFGGPIEPWFPTSPDEDYLAAFPALRNGFCGLDYQIDEGVLSEDLRGANMAFRRSAVGDLRFDTRYGMKPTSGLEPGLAVGGYEETDFVNRLQEGGAEMVWIPSMRVKHYVDPSRMELPYLIRFTRDNGRIQVRTGGVPSGKRVMGIPRWLYRLWLETRVRRFLAKLAGRRLESLKLLHKCCVLEGMIMECREITRKGSVSEQIVASVS